MDRGSHLSRFVPVLFRCLFNFLFFCLAFRTLASLGSLSWPPCSCLRFGFVFSCLKLVASSSVFWSSCLRFGFERSACCLRGNTVHDGFDIDVFVFATLSRFILAECEARLQCCTPIWLAMLSRAFLFAWKHCAYFLSGQTTTRRRSSTVGGPHCCS